MQENTSQEIIQPEIIQQLDPLNIKDITWRQEGYHLIGVFSNGIRFGTRIKNDLRLVGVDKDNKPILKRIDI